MKRKMFLTLLMLSLMLGTGVVSASAVSYNYNTLYLGNDVNGDPIYKAITDDVVGMAGGKVRFWLKLGSECPPPRDDISPFIDLVAEGGSLIAYYTFIGYGDMVVTVRAHFQGEQYSVWGECITVPWLTSLPIALLGCVGIIEYLKKKNKISL